MSLGAYLVGVALLLLTLGASATTAWLMVDRRSPELTGVPKTVALGIGAVLAVLLAHVVPLLLGVLDRVTAPLTAVLLAGAAVAAPRRAARPAEEPETGRPGPLAGAGIFLVAGVVVGYLTLRASAPPSSIDAGGFHLPSAIRFLQAGSLWPLAQYLPFQAQGNYPQSGDVLLLASMLPFRSLAFVRLVEPLLLALTVLAIYGAARELRAPASTSALAACCVAALGPVAFVSLEDLLVDPTFTAGFAAGILFLLRHLRTGTRADLIWAGLGLGLALGTKWYGLTDVPILIVGWAVTALATGLNRRAVLRGGALLVGLVAVAGGLWLVRNLVLSGNPLFQYKVQVLGVTLFDAPFDELRAQVGYTLAHYATDPGVLREYVFPVFKRDFGLPGLLLALAPLAALLPGAGARVRFLAVSAVLLMLAYAVTPYSALGLEGEPVLVTANTRYGVPALLAAAPILAWVVGRVPRARPIAEVVLLLGALAGLHEHLPLGPARVVAGAVAVVAAAAAVVALIRVRDTRVAVAAIALASVAGIALGRHLEQAAARAGFLPTDATVEYVRASAPDGRRIAITGVWSAAGLVPTAALFGPTFDNHVAYLGPFVDHLRRTYTDRAAFLRALERGDYDLLEVGLGSPPRPSAKEERWARSAGWREVSRSPRFVLLAPPAQAPQPDQGARS